MLCPIDAVIASFAEFFDLRRAAGIVPPDAAALDSQMLRRLSSNRWKTGAC